MKKYLAELIGTFALVFVGTGSVIVNELSGGSLGLVGVSLAFGIIISAMVYIFGNISGTHINPAVTIALTIGKQFPVKKAGFYILVQVSGAFLASLLLSIIFPKSQILGVTIPSEGVAQSFVIELVLTFFLMLTILGVTSKKEFTNIAGLLIGLVVTGLILFAGPISGGSFNPARSLAPAIISGNIESLWVYISSPTLGAILAILCWKFINKNI